MKINVFDIPLEKGRSFTFTGTEPFLGSILENLVAGDPAAGSLPVAPEIRAEVHLEREGRQVTVTGEAHAVLNPPCARCVEPVQTRLDPTFSLFYLPAPPDDGTEDAQLGEEELDESTYRDDEIDLSVVLNEQLLLERPFKVLCSEDCRGLCAECGANLNEVVACGCPAQPKSLAFLALADLKSKLPDV